VAARESFRDIEYEVTERDGTTHYYSICGLPVFDSDKQFIGYRGTGRSITDRKTGEAKLLYLSRYDSLTGLPNRALMEDRLAQALAHAERTSALVALLFIDLDHFKRVNDSLGHPVGDELLKAVGQRLLRIVRKSDTVSRLGGDEFIVLLTEVRNINGVANIAKKIIAAVAEPHEIDKNVLYVSCSIGIAAHPMDGKTPQDLLKNADAALYHAKQHGRNNFQFFTSEINARLADRLVLESDLRRALQDGEFLLHYQKKIAAYSGQLTGVEALIRWQHPSRGLLHPSSFISVAEECGLIPRIGEWVLNEACRQNKDWQDRKLFEVPIAVNVSSLQFGQRSFVDSLDNALHTYSLRPEFLELELTESAVMKDGEESITILKRLKKKGVQITIDDFGTAYSSLNYLKRFPIDKVKIDKSFVSEIASDKIDFAIVGAIVTLAHSMGLKVVAEGVETATQRDLVSTHWCDELQGYLFGRPVDAVQFEREIVSSEGAV
jgi:diguanylate cyclase (GGDEF)-like protein